ncbi:MAG: AlkA N-terminal domain-containing protein [Coxiellaceae bacterium]|nr:AlkA N-terminal domain-containing protein [Coxiellaceae bacterium]
MNITYDRQEFYRAHLARDKRFDGKFFVAVKTTKIYCRPTCPARKAKLENLDFYLYAAQAEEAGFRPCMRCRPETAPGSAAWIGTSACVQRAVRMMDAISNEDVSVSLIAERLGVSDRWLRELFHEQVGASPQSVLLYKKLNVARNLLDNSSLSITDIAFSSGFQSIRRFNDAFKKRFKQTPSEIRKATPAQSLLQLELSYRPPYDWQSLITFFSARTLPNTELVDDNSYQRIFTCADGHGWLKVTRGEHNKMLVQLKLDKPTNIMGIVANIKDMFDLDADPMMIAKDLSSDKKLRPLLQQLPGIRIPGCIEPFEMAVRAIVGQKISVKGARQALIKLVELCGEDQIFDEGIALKKYFPTPQNILGADLSTVGLTNAKINALKLLAAAIDEGSIVLDGTADYDETCQQLLALKGIGPWTVELIAMRVLRNPNAFPEKDLEILKQVKRYDLNPKLWVPWRAYAAMLLLNS